MPQKRILIVDDEPKVGFFLGRSLELTASEYDVSVVHSGDEAVETLQRQPVDLLITDLRMSGINGLDLIRWVRSNSPNTRSILMTAYGNDEIEAEGRRLQVYRYLTKPFDAHTFTRAVQQALSEIPAQRAGLIVFSDTAFEAMAEHLEELRGEIGARCILLADAQGQLLTTVGDTTGLDAATLLALLAGTFAASAELAHQFGNGQGVNLNFHEGTRYEFCSVNAGDQLLLAMVYDRQVQKSRIGLVWLYTRRAVDELLAILSDAKEQGVEEILNADFSSSVISELDNLFMARDADQPAEAAPVSQEPVPVDRRADTISDALSEKRIHRAKNDVIQSSPQKLLSLSEAIELGIVPADLKFQDTYESEDN